MTLKRKVQTSNSAATFTTNPENHRVSFEWNEGKTVPMPPLLTVNKLQCSKKAEDFAS